MDQSTNTTTTVVRQRGIKGRLSGLYAHDSTTKALATIGLFVVLVLFIVLALVAVKYAGVALRSASTAAVTLSSKLFSIESVVPTVSAKEVKVGVPFTISWEHKNQANDGSYSIYYPCVDGLYLTAQTVSGNQAVLCNKNFDFINQNDQLNLVASSTHTRSATLPIEIRFTKNGSTEPTISGVMQVTVINDALHNAPNTEVATTQNTGTTHVVSNQTNNTQTYVTGTQTSLNNPNGRVDLAVTILDKGYLDSNNNFISNSNPVRSNRVAVRFRIDNLGDKASGAFHFNAYLPTYPSQTYNADLQPSMNGGDHTEYTIAFDKALPGIQNFRVLVDPALEISESNETNNDVSTSINIQ